MSAEVRRQLLETVADEAARLNRLLENILQMSKLEAGAAAPNRQWHVSGRSHRLGSASNIPLSGKSSSCCSRAGRSSACICRWASAGTGICEPVRECRKVHTICSEVSVFAQRDSEQLRIVVSDNGPGIPGGAEDRIFEKFFRAMPVDAGRGSGLGLAICRAIVTAHGGTIQASNRPSGGAEFTILLPIGNDARKLW